MGGGEWGRNAFRPLADGCHGSISNIYGHLVTLVTILSFRAYQDITICGIGIEHENASISW
jgi:hypothetical protein